MNIAPHIENIDCFLIIFQFSEDQAAKVMSWLPRKLSPQVRCVFSLIGDSIQHTTLVKRETKPIEINLQPLNLESRKVKSLY